MTPLLETVPLLVILYACALAFMAGLLKGSVGFGLPTVMIAGFSAVMAPDVALATLIVPALVSNGWQALRGGMAAVRLSIRRFRMFLLTGAVMLLLSAQLVPFLPSNLMLLMIGIPVVLFALNGLFGRALELPSEPSPRMQGWVGAAAGVFGGITGIWGPPTVALLVAMRLPKSDQMCIQGVIFGLGSLTLMVAHLGSGVLSAGTLPLSLLVTVPALLGMFIGFRLQDRLDADGFARLTYCALCAAGLYLILRGAAG